MEDAHFPKQANSQKYEMSIVEGTMSPKANQQKKLQTRRKTRPRLPSIPPLRKNPKEAGSDFFRYVNGNWISDVHVPPYIASFGVSEEIEQVIENQLKEAVNTCIAKSKEPPTKGYVHSVERAIGLVAQSALRTHTQEKSVQSLKRILHRLDCLETPEDIAKTMGHMLRFKIPTVFWIYGDYENSKKTEYCLSIGVGRVGLPDLSYYEKTAPGKSKTLLQYATLLQTVGHMLDVDSLSEGIQLEAILAKEIKKSLSDSTEPYKGTEVAAKFPAIPFDVLFEAYGLQSWKTQTFFIDSKHWLRTVSNLFKNLPLEGWKLLFALQLVLYFLPFLPPPYDDLHFSFFHRKLRGQTEKIPQNRLTLRILEQWMTPFMSRMFVEEIADSTVKASATRFVKEIVDAAKERIGQVEWLIPSTRMKAREKVEKMRVSVGYPESFRTLPIPSVQNENLLENLLSLGIWETEYERMRLGEKRDQQKDWDEPVFDVNAYYYSQANEMVIPYGSLLWPFFHPSAPMGWNYGGLGCILAHEMTHAFDKEGKEYNPDGLKKKWWTPKDTRAYTKKTKALVSLFGSKKVLGHPVSGTLTLSENIADLGGLAIALYALGKKIETHSESEKKEAHRQFFLSYATSWRVKEKPAKVLQALFLDHHAPPSLRVNMIASQFQEWYDAFDIQETDPLYIPPEKRIRIF